jgi:topoisomerase-4 subunit A
MPVQMTCTQVIQHHAKQLVGILKQELELEKEGLLEKLHLRTLERIFVEERIYKKIETQKTEEGVNKAVKDGFKPFAAELIRPITDEDVDHLLKIPIRRISLYDMSKNKAEVEAINARIKEINRLLKHLVDYAISWLDGIEKKLAGLGEEALKRHTQITNINAVDVKAVTKRDLSLKYDEKNGNLGTEVSGGIEVLKVTPYDKVLYVRKSGIYSVSESPKKIFVGPEMRYCGLADKESLSKVLFTIIYRDPETQFVYVKRCKIQGYIMNRDYFFAPEGCEVLHVDTRKSFTF